ncbi:MAG: tRNA (adenosine(37)-N6)-threonylcarbamoyltransferase complex dimerization subunit type 1 TsaB [Kofleriaceae bacterium]|nr:tRNA (adenosine(37)-N6)-threonylcarbamoyltransferase complex dimerization subunit type 1 TsaB [Kofleriaceae bacterium]
MTAILAIESSTLTASVALLVDGEIVYDKESGVNSHSEILLSLVDEALRHASLTLRDLQTIAIGQGPGSFTGLRIGMATVKGLCFASEVSLTPVSSLAAVALDGFRHCPSDSLLLSVLDARRGEIFVCAFTKGSDTLDVVNAVGAEQVMKPSDFAQYAASQRTSSPILCGSGAHKYLEEVGKSGEFLADARLTPSAAAVAKLAQHLPASEELAEVAPSYVRLSEAEIKFPNGNTGGTFSFQQK